MRGSLIISILFHAALLGYGIFYYVGSDTLPKVAPVKSLPVDLVKIGPETKVTGGDKKSKIKDKQALSKKPVPDPKTEVKKKIKKPKPAPKEAAKAAHEQPKPEVKPIEKKTAKKEPEKKEPPKEAKKLDELIKKVADKKPAPAPKPKVKEKPKPKKQKKVITKKKKYETTKQSALLNKTPDRTAALPKAKQGDKDQKAHGLGEGVDRVALISEKDDLIRQVQNCWNFPAGARDAHHLIAKIRMELNPNDGTIKGHPTIHNSINHQFFDVVAEAGQRAAIQCQPYRLGPNMKKYFLSHPGEGVVITFDPRAMLGG